MAGLAPSSALALKGIDNRANVVRVMASFFNILFIIIPPFR
jgi:hypothetical protein